ncbi:MAG: hypothetical protein ACE5EN_06590 [Nitrospinota bacterium]
MSSKFEVLDAEENTLAKALRNSKLITEKSLNDYIEFRKKKDETGKTYLGRILVEQGLITDEDLREFVDDSNKLHMEFCDTLLDKGYITEEQLEHVWRRRDDSGEDVIAILEDEGIMTRDSFAKIFDKNTSAGNLRLGEWLVLNKKVTNEQVLSARDLQRINTLSDYLLHNKLITEEALAKVKAGLEGSVGEILNRPGINQ